MVASVRLVFAVALVAYTQSALAADTQPQVLSAEGGRYVLGRLNHQRADQFMLDTKTGRLWRIVEGASGSGAITLEPVMYVDVNGGRTELPKDVQLSPQAPTKK